MLDQKLRICCWIPGSVVGTKILSLSSLSLSLSLSLSFPLFRICCWILGSVGGSTSLSLLFPLSLFLSLFFLSLSSLYLSLSVFLSSSITLSSSLSTMIFYWIQNLGSVIGSFNLKLNSNLSDLSLDSMICFWIKKF